MNRKVFLAISYTKRRKVEKAITKFFTSRGFDVVTGRKIRSGKNQDDELIRLIEDCDFGVVVYNELRHNISYEWGLLTALIDENGHIFAFKDANIHINLKNEFSDKDGINITHFYGEDPEKDIIKSLEENEGLMDMIRECIRKSISIEQNETVTEAAKAIVNADLPLNPILDPEKGQIISNNIPNDADLKNLKDKLGKIPNLTVEGHFYKSLTHFYMGELEQAEIEITKAINRDPNIAVLHENRGVILSKLGRDEEAEFDLSAALSLDPENYHTHINLGIVLTKLNRFEEAKTEVEEGISLEPDSALGYAILGGVFLHLNEYKNAEKSLLKSIDLDPNLEMSYGILGALYLHQDRISEGEKVLIKALTLDPGDIGVHICLSRIHVKLKKHLEAERELRLAIKLEPDNAQAHSALGFFLLDTLGEELEAEKELKIALDLDSEGIKIEYGVFLIQKKDYEEAKKVFMELNQSDPDNPLVHVYLGYIFDNQGHDELAKKEYEMALDLDPDDLNILIQFGAFLINRGNISEAKKINLKARAIDPNNLTLLQNLSELYILLSDFTESYNIAKKGFDISKTLKDKIITRFLMFINEILLGKNPDEIPLINFFKENQGYTVSFEFKTLKSHLKTSEYYGEIVNLINEIEKYSKKN